MLFVASLALLVFTFRKPKKVSMLSLVITIAISLLTLVIFSVLINYDPPLWMWLLMAAIGMAVGYFWARATKVFAQDNRIMSRNSIWYLVVWGAIFTCNQLITILTNRPPDIAMALLIISTATVWGTNASIMRRYFLVRGELQTLPAGQAAAAQTQASPTPPAPEVRTPATPPPAALADSVTAKPTGNLPKAPTPTTDKTGFCYKCGAPLKQGASFCMKCGVKV